MADDFKRETHLPPHDVHASCNNPIIVELYWYQQKGCSRIRACTVLTAAERFKPCVRFVETQQLQRIVDCVASEFDGKCKSVGAFAKRAQYKYLLMIRDPREVTISEFFHKQGIGKMKQTLEEHVYQRLPANAGGNFQLFLKILLGFLYILCPKLPCLGCWQRLRFNLGTFFIKVVLGK